MFIKLNYLFKVLVFCSLLAEVLCVEIRLANDNKDNSHSSNYNNYRTPDTYSYNYDISDQSTGDQKTQWEKRENGVVHGAYTVLEPDGSTRLVEYTADQNGFHPMVTKLDNRGNSPRNPVPSYDANTRNIGIYNPADLTYNNQEDQSRFDNNGYINNDRGDLFANTHRRPFVNTGYTDRYYNRGRLPAYERLYVGSDGVNVATAPLRLPLRQEQQPTPLLHSAYHGYDNLYH